MAESIKKSPVDSVLECPLCLHQLKLPLTLQQCLHSFCKSCLDKLPQKTQDGRQGWLCPMCENFTKCDQIQQNTFIEELQKVHNEPEHGDKLNCEQCSDDCSPATWKCAECKIGLCESAKISHLRIPMLKGHNVTSLESGQEKLIDNIVFCKLHEDIPVQMKCTDCNQLICYKCNTTEHQQHRVETVEQALESTLPVTESSVRQVDEKISIIEAQIHGVNKEIEQTKESYASCRIQMDDHLEKVICQMRAMKAQMEEDVNEKESIALDTLKKLKQQLEKQLSQARIISNLTAVVTTRTRHTSQLQQFQTGLFQKVKTAGEVKNQSLSLNLPSTNFVKGQRFQEDIDKVFGKLGFDVKEQIINIWGESYTKSNQFLCSDLNKLAKAKYKKDKEIVVDVDWCNKLSYIENKIWLPLISRNKINIYDEDGELIKVIDTGDESITVVKMGHNGDMICAGDSGVFVTDEQFCKWTKLSNGMYSDVIVGKDQFLALQYDNPSVHTFSIPRTADNVQESSWCECHCFMLNEDVKVNSSSCFCIVDAQYILISSASGKTKGLYKLTRGGVHLNSCRDLPFYPIICGTDENNQVLVSDFTNGTMYLLNTLSEKEIQRTAILSNVHAPETRSVVIDQNHSFWFLTGNDDFKLVKFASQQ